MIDQSLLLWSTLDLIVIAIGSFFCASVLIVVFIPLAKALNLVDEPDSRKQHPGSIPLVGGLGIAASVIVVLISAGALANPSTHILLIIGSILVLLGMLDDFFDISPRYRLLVQIAVGLALCFAADLKIVSVGDLFGSGHVTLGIFVSVIFTVMCSVGVFNSINMIDGIDGLAGTVVSLSIAALLSITLFAGDFYSAGILISVIGAVSAYMMFMLCAYGPVRKIFLGDSGSLFLGFLLLWFFIYLSQGDDAPMSPVAAGWIFGLPLADTISVIVGRLLRGEHPLAAGRDHIHHRLMSLGFSARQVLLILGVYHATLVFVGVYCNIHTDMEPLLFWGFVAVTVLHFSILAVVSSRQKRVSI